MIKTAALIIATFVIGTTTGYLTGQQTTANADHAHDEHEHTTATHTHEQQEAVTPYPTIDLDVQKDPKSGWNAHITVENFSFAPERASTDHISGEGHAHIYVDGEKINRVYGNWYHLGELPTGSHEITVNLTTNDHHELTNNAEVISASKTINVMPE